VRLNEIYEQYKNDVHFLTVYIREAHPSDGIQTPRNVKENILFKAPTTDDERAEIAAVCRLNLELKLPMALDAIDNDVEEKYISIPKRLYLVDREGKIAYTGERGPRGFHPDSWEEAIRGQIALVGAA